VAHLAALVCGLGCGSCFLGLFLGCGSRDEPRGASPEPEASPTWQVLTEPESIDVLCRIAGVATPGAVDGSTDSTAACQDFVEQCRDVAGVLSALGGGGPGGQSDVDLEPILGCSVTAGQLDACLAQVLERGIDLYGDDVTCGATDLPEVDPADLVLVPGCLGVALRCPELLQDMF